jgi:predicted phage terminase large subunit-like protein
MWVWGLDPFGNHFLVDMIREKINLSGRWTHLKKMMMRHPTILKCYYESYGMQADIEHFNSKMMEEGVYFSIEELSGKLAKVDRIRKLIPLFENGRVFLPEVLFSDDGRDLIDEFINEEYLLFPFAPHDDMLDAASRIRDEKAEVYKPMDFPSEDDEDSNVIQLNNWTHRKANSRYANV